MVRLTLRRLFVVFGSPKKPTLLPARAERAAHAEHAVFEIYVVPPEGQELALPQAGGDGQDVEGFEPVTAGTASSRRRASLSWA